MPFTPPPAPRNIIGTGNPNAKVLLVGDCPKPAAFRQRVPIAPPDEGVLESCLHNAGLIKGEIYITNLIDDDPHLERYWQPTKGAKKGYIKCDISEYRERFHQTLATVNPKVIVTLGELPACAIAGNGTLMGKVGIRGYPFHYFAVNRSFTVIPSLHPGAMIWSNYIWRYYFSHDLQKAKKIAYGEAKAYGPEIKVIIPDTFEEAKELLMDAERCPKLSVDIEVSNYEVSCIGFALSPTTAFSIPFDMRWTELEEVQLWNLVAGILQDEGITKIGQNFIFDIYFLALKMGIITKGPIIDAMTGHSILYPEFLKSLNFLGSLYTYQAQWKNMVSHKDIKQES